MLSQSSLLKLYEINAQVCLVVVNKNCVTLFLVVVLLHFTDLPLTACKDIILGVVLDQPSLSSPHRGDHRLHREATQSWYILLTTLLKWSWWHERNACILLCTHGFCTQSESSRAVTWSNFWLYFFWDEGKKSSSTYCSFNTYGCLRIYGRPCNNDTKLSICSNRKKSSESGQSIFTGHLFLFLLKCTLKTEDHISGTDIFHFNPISLKDILL